MAKMTLERFIRDMFELQEMRLLRDSGNSDIDRDYMEKLRLIQQREKRENERVIHEKRSIGRGLTTPTQDKPNDKTE